MALADMQANPRLTPEQMFSSKTVEGELMRAGADLEARFQREHRGKGAQELVDAIDALAETRTDQSEVELVGYLARVYAPELLKPEPWWKRHAGLVNFVAFLVLLAMVYVPPVVVLALLPEAERTFWVRALLGIMALVSMLSLLGICHARKWRLIR